eukprot:scaffold10406_cov68-Phaeocystis_antarctica.AAC.5
MGRSPRRMTVSIASTLRGPLTRLSTHHCHRYLAGCGGLNGDTSVQNDRGTCEDCAPVLSPRTSQDKLAPLRSPCGALFLSWQDYYKMESSLAPVLDTPHSIPRCPSCPLTHPCTSLVAHASHRGP